MKDGIERNISSIELDLERINIIINVKKIFYFSLSMKKMRENINRSFKYKINKKLYLQFTNSKRMANSVINVVI